MKILKTDSFVSERIKVQPVTNAELDIIQKDVSKQIGHDSSLYLKKVDNFKKSDIETGDLVITSDVGTSNAYIAIDNTNKTLPTWPEKLLLVCFNRFGSPHYLRLCDYDDELKYKNSLYSRYDIKYVFNTDYDASDLATLRDMDLALVECRKIIKRLYPEIGKEIA